MFLLFLLRSSFFFCHLCFWWFIDKTLTLCEWESNLNRESANKRNTLWIWIWNNMTYEWVWLFQSCNITKLISLSLDQINIGAYSPLFTAIILLTGWCHSRCQICTLARFHSLTNGQYGLLQSHRLTVLARSYIDISLFFSQCAATIFYARHSDYCYYTQQ